MDIKKLKAELNYSFSRSSGAGGQNVNKVETKVTLTWDMGHSNLISDAHKNRFKNKFPSYVLESGVVQIVSQKFRIRDRNISDCQEKLIKGLFSVLHPPKKRKKTRPTKASKERRLKEKKSRSEVKSLRRSKPDY